MKHKWISVLVSMAIALSAWGLMPTGKAWAATCTSTKTGNWNDSTVWSCGVVPGSGDDVTILNTHQITLTQDESINNITIGNAADRLVGAFTLQVFGTLNSATALNTDVISGSTLIRFVGSTSRALFGANWSGSTSGLSFEVALDSAATGTASTAVKGKSITIVSGTFNVADEVRPDAGSANTGSLIINAGATLIVSGRLSRTATANIPFAAFTNNGTFRTRSGSAQVWPDATPCTFASTSIVEYSFSSQIIQIPLGTDYGNLILSGGGTKTAPANLQIRGNLTANGTTFAAGTGTANFIGTIQQVIGGSSTIAFNTLNVASGANVVLPATATATSLTNSGTITQTQTVNGNTNVTFVGIGGYGGVVLNANNLNLGSTTVAIKGNQNCDANDTSVRRCFNITPITTTLRNATITFFFSADELGKQTCDTSLKVWHWTGSAWASAGTSAAPICGSTPRSVQVTGVSSFSPFVLSDGISGPTAITLREIKAAPSSSLIIWPVLAVSIIVLSAAFIHRRRSRAA